MSFLGLRAIEVFIECAQSRRLPYVQIIGASAAAANEQRERVMAALEASGFRLPGRRLTVRYSPDVHGLPLENFDCALALSILGSAKAFPARENDAFFVFGSLGLNGALRSSVDPALLRAWLRENPAEVLYLPWEESIALGDEGKGGGFHDLRSLVHHLREGKHNGPRKLNGGSEAAVIPSEITIAKDLSAAEQRLVEISAAGGHPILVIDGDEEQGTRLAAAIRALLPPQPHAESSLDGRPLRTLRESQAQRLFRFDRKHGTWGELSLAHGGVLHLREFRNENKSLGPLWEAMREGSLRYTLGQRSVRSPAGICVVAETASCDCGGSSRLRAACICRPAMKERRLRAFASAPFDLRCFLAPSFPAEGRLNSILVSKARAQMLKTRGKLNAHLTLTESLRAKEWSQEAREWLRVGDRKLGTTEALARTALTVSDLRAGEAVSRSDLLEAWHHVAGLEFAGMSAPRRSVPLLNSTAIP